MRATKARLNAQAYRAAAKLLEDRGGGIGCCLALCYVSYYPWELASDETPHHQDALARYFKPLNRQRGEYWWGHPEEGVDRRNGNTFAGERILALCFMAAMVDAGDV